MTLALQFSWQEHGGLRIRNIQPNNSTSGVCLIIQSFEDRLRNVKYIPSGSSVEEQNPPTPSEVSLQQ